MILNDASRIPKQTKCSMWPKCSKAVCMTLCVCAQAGCRVGHGFQTNLALHPDKTMWHVSGYALEEWFEQSTDVDPGFVHFLSLRRQKQGWLQTEMLAYSCCTASQSLYSLSTSLPVLPAITIIICQAADQAAAGRLRPGVTKACFGTPNFET